MSYYDSPENIYNQMKLMISNVDTSENSYVYNVIMPVAFQMAYSLMLMDQVENKVFASKAVENGYSKYLELRTAEVAINRKTASYAEPEVTFTGQVGTTIRQGYIVSTNDNRLYTTISEVTIGSDGTATTTVKAEESGSTYNVKVGDICYLPIKYSGIVSVTNKNAYYDAYDDESDEDLYARYLTKVQDSPTSGNVAHYKKWCLEVNGVGSVSVYPLKDENFNTKNGHVVCIITNSNKRSASAELISAVKNYVDPNNGDGTGQAPIGAYVHILSATEVPINITANISIDSTTTLANVQSAFQTAITTYLEEVVYDTKKIVYTKVGGLLSDISGVTDYSNLKINNTTTNVTLTNVQIGVVGTVTLTQV